jgi:hypothetical protein
MGWIYYALCHLFGHDHICGGSYPQYGFCVRSNSALDMEYFDESMT